jgi:hypothetical protein
VVDGEEIEQEGVLAGQLTNAVRVTRIDDLGSCSLRAGKGQN